MKKSTPIDHHRMAFYVLQKFVLKKQVDRRSAEDYL